MRRMDCVTKEGFGVVVYSQPQSHGWEGNKGHKILVLSENFVCLLSLREVACAQYLPEAGCGGKAPWIQEWPMEERLLVQSHTFSHLKAQDTAEPNQGAKVVTKTWLLLIMF